MSLKNDYPVFIDEVQLPFGKSWTEKSNVVENTKQTEAGTTIYSVTRFDKLSISVRFGCTHALAKKLKELSKRQELTLKRYDILEEDYEERQVVIRSFQVALSAGSEALDVTNGVWTVSFNIEEI